MVSEYAKFMSNIQENEEGGISQMENIDEVKVEEVVEPEVNTIDETETEVVVEVTEPVAEVEAEEPATEVEVVEETIETEEQPAEDVQTEEAPAEETEFAADEDKEDESEEESDDKEDDKEDEKECPECGENPCVCENACNDKEDKYSLEIAELKAKNESLTQALNAANEALNKYTRKEKLEIISKFSTKLENGEELIASLTEKVDELTKDEIKAELGSALVEQIEAEEVVEEETEEAPSNFSLNINVNNELGNTAWDLVKRYKANK
jgi:hypothetical protein